MITGIQTQFERIFAESLTSIDKGICFWFVFTSRCVTGADVNSSFG